MISWTDAKAISGLFSTSHETWYPLTEIAKSPRDRRRDLLLAAAERAGRLRALPKVDETLRHRRKSTLVFAVAASAWLLFVFAGAAQRPNAFDIVGFCQMGLAPTLAAWVFFLGNPFRRW